MILGKLSRSCHNISSNLKRRIQFRRDKENIRFFWVYLKLVSVAPIFKLIQFSIAFSLKIRKG